MSSPSKAWVTLLSLLALAVLLYVVFKIKPDILGPIGGGVASMRKPPPEMDTSSAHRGDPAPEPTTQGSTGPKPEKDVEPVVVAAKIASGDVISYADGELLLRLQGGRKVKFSVTEKTKVTPELKSGKRVSVQYREEDGQKIALWVQPAGPPILAGDR
jgi:hypothetical protein